MAIFVTPGSEAFFKSGLAKSAFHPDIYGGLPLDYFITGIDMTSRLARLHDVVPKFYQAHDLFLMHYQPHELVVGTLKQANKAAPAWRAFIEGMTKRPEFFEVNQVTRGSFELAAAAAARALSIALGMKVQISPDPRHTYDLEALNSIVRDIEQGRAPQGLEDEVKAAGGPQRYLKLVERWIRDAGKSAAMQLEAVVKELKEYLDAKGEAEAAAMQLAGGRGYALEGLSIWQFCQDPDEFRRRIKLLSTAALALRTFSRVIPTSLSHQQTESLWGGVDGVTKMTQYAQLKEVLPAELALAQMDQTRALFAVKVAQMALSVYRHSSSMKLAIFVDKSGSMAGELSGELGVEGVPKISLAAGLAVALYRKYNSAVYLFDTEIDKVEPKDVVKLLLTIEADGGTNIDPVLEEIVRIGRRDHLYIIISDGITEASEEVMKKLTTSNMAKQTRLIVVPPSGDGYKWVELLRRHGRVVNARDVAGFVAAARQALA